MHPDIALLLDVQEIDNEIAELQDQLNNYPVIWNEIKEELRRKTDKVEALETREQERDKERKRIEQDLRLSTEKFKQYQAQQMLVKTSKELTAINAQIDSLKKSIQRLEERGTSLLEESDTAAAELEKARGSLKEAKERARTERDRIRTQVATKKERIGVLQNDRKQVVQKVSPESLEVYERVRRRRPTNPVVPVRNESCQGCNFAILPNRLVELHKGESVVHCDNCGRILSEDETYEENQESA